MRHALLPLLLALATSAGAQGVAPSVASMGPTTPTAPSQGEGEGVVRKTAKGVCMEPSHPRYDAAPYVDSYPDTRACFRDGGYLDAPRDRILENQPARPDAAERGMPPIASDAPMVDLPGSGRWTGDEGMPRLPYDPALENRPPPDVDASLRGTIDEALASMGVASEGVASTAPMRPRMPQGIDLDEPPSYSRGSAKEQEQPVYQGRSAQDQDPVIFRPPSAYIGRSPRDFLP